MFAKTRTLAAALIMSLLMAGCLTTKETKKFRAVDTTEPFVSIRHNFVAA